MVIARSTQKRFGRPDAQGEQVAKLATGAVRWVIVAVAIATSLKFLGLDLGWLTMTIVFLGFAVLLIGRPLAENFTGGVILTLRQAFGVGDEIELDELRGEIIEFTDHITVLRLRDGRRMHVPNKKMLEKTVIVNTTDQSRRSSVEFAIDEDADIPIANWPASPQSPGVAGMLGNR